MRLSETRDDLNPILYEGAPSSTGGLEEAVKLCDQLEIQLVLDPPREAYLHGWGITCALSKLIIATWVLIVNDINGFPTPLPFDLVEESSPLIIGLDLKNMPIP